MSASPPIASLEDLACVRNEIFADELTDILTRQMHVSERPAEEEKKSRKKAASPTCHLGSSTRLKELIEALQEEARFTGAAGEADHQRAGELLARIHRFLSANDVPDTAADRALVRALCQGDADALASLTTTTKTA